MEAWVECGVVWVEVAEVGYFFGHVERWRRCRRWRVDRFGLWSRGDLRRRHDWCSGRGVGGRGYCLTTEREKGFGRIVDDFAAIRASEVVDDGPGVEFAFDLLVEEWEGKELRESGQRPATTGKELKIES